MGDTSHHTSPIERCPDEILFSTGKDLDRMAIFALRLASRRLNAIFTPFTLRNRSVRYFLEYEESANATAWWVLGRNRTSCGTSYIDLAQVMPAPAVLVPFISSLRIHIGCMNASADFHGSEVANKLEPLLNDLLTYKSLRGLDVQWNRYFPMAFYHLIIPQLLQTVHQATSGQLSFLSWSILRIQQPLTLQHLSPFRNLEHVELRDMTVNFFQIEQGLTETPPSFLGDIVRHNPQLRSLRLACNSSNPICDLEELFPPEHYEMDIERLEILGILPNAPHSSQAPGGRPLHLPKLTKLSELSIRSVLSPKALVNLDQLWLTLCDSSTCLTKLSLDQGISNLLMDYLASYTGLQHLRLSINTPSPTDSPVPSTFAQALLRHASSLVSFCIEVNMRESQASTWRGDLEINPLAWPKPSLFRQLKKLKVVSPKASSWQLTGDNFQKILDYATGIPQLKELTVIWSQTDRENFDQEWSRAEEALLIRRCKLAILEIDTCWPGIKQTVFKLEFPPLPPSQQMDSEDSSPGEQLFQLKSLRVSWKWD